jgi:hypothetical protein
MIFGNPEAAFLFFLLVPMILLFVLGEKGRQQALESFAAKELLPELLLFSAGKKRRIGTIVLLLAFSLCIVALMRPQGGVLDSREKPKGSILSLPLTRPGACWPGMSNRIAWRRPKPLRLMSSGN